MTNEKNNQKQSEVLSANASGLIAQSVADVEQSRARVPDLQNAIKPKDKQRVLKPRPDTERRAMEMVVAGTNFPQYVPATLVAELDAVLTYIAALRTYQAALTNALQVVDDTMFVKLSVAWKSALDIYSALQRQTTLKPELIPGLANMTASLSLGPRTPRTPAANGAGAPASVPIVNTTIVNTVPAGSTTAVSTNGSAPADPATH